MVLFDLTMHDAAAGLAGLNRRLEALGAHYRWPTRAQGALQVGLDDVLAEEGAPPLKVANGDD